MVPLAMMPVAWCEPDQESRMVLKIERFQPEGMNVRMSGGKPSYSHVVTVSGSGKIVYTAGASCVPNASRTVRT